LCSFAAIFIFRCSFAALRPLRPPVQNWVVAAQAALGESVFIRGFNRFSSLLCFFVVQSVWSQFASTIQPLAFASTPSYFAN